VSLPRLQCGPGISSQRWTGYSDGTLRIHGRCLDVSGPGADVKVQVAAYTGAASNRAELPRGRIADGTRRQWSPTTA
jgi:hypothetical protein